MLTDVPGPVAHKWYYIKSCLHDLQYHGHMWRYNLSLCSIQSQNLSLHVSRGLLLYSSLGIKCVKLCFQRQQHCKTQIIQSLTVHSVNGYNALFVNEKNTYTLNQHHCSDLFDIVIYISALQSYPDIAVIKYHATIHCYTCDALYSISINLCMFVHCVL